MTSRRAVSPVIATVILIAVAVALGIAVAVWAGALTGSLQKTEKLVISAYPDSTQTSIIVSVTNSGASPITITQLQWNGIPQPLGTNVTIVTGFGTGFSLASGATGTMTFTAVSVGAKDGVQYPITLVTAAGNSYPSTITWP